MAAVLLRVGVAAVGLVGVYLFKKFFEGEENDTDNDNDNDGSRPRSSSTGRHTEPSPPPNPATTGARRTTPAYSGSSAHQSTYAAVDAQSQSQGSRSTASRPSFRSAEPQGESVRSPNIGRHFSPPQQVPDLSGPAVHPSVAPPWLRAHGSTQNALRGGGGGGAAKYNRMRATSRRGHTDMARLA
eukprot:CAMPEP_0204083688 /NCGR_PEP_ID=MMETSP0360-20130528/178934_1 /ASSEMBLY_ACC=CAM_ASM_000342 /TAXON_ID=268821 /ORGANISM="Scrippsiella Hangoei, Strain SHTV-5" /LENGTH=184 /DNA_ID=CAMNT_0051032635 /DNA_START=10 /DNA_END=565 /DNA_ORIENTATION=+